MKKILCLVGFSQLVLGGIVCSQNIPTGVTAPASKAAVKVSAVPAASAFYQRVFTPNKSIVDSSLVNLSAVIEDVGVSTQYNDGLGRPLETVVKQASPLKKDFVNTYYYDAYGNPSLNYLPYTARTGNSNDGLFKTNPIRDDSSFYALQFPNEDVYYAKTLYDGSPLNKTIKQMGAGNSWTGSGVGVSSDERANQVNDSVRVWLINILNEDDIPTTTTTYAAGSLLETESTDERSTKTITYIDELGRTILTKTQISGTYYSGHTGWLCTYYVYDEMNHLRMVIPPKAVSFLQANNWDLSGNSDVVNNLCYSYWYDSRGRVIEKHVPSKGKTYAAYDLFDRVVMIQDDNLRLTNQWSFTKYDGQGRPDSTGLITSSLTQTQVIANAALSKDYPLVTGSTYTLLSVNYYDDYTWVTGSIPSSTLATTNINSTNFITTYNTSPIYAQQLTQTYRIRGMVTGSRTLVLGTSTYLYSVKIYDEKGRVVQVKQTNFTGGTDISTSQYDFSGKMLRNHLQHQKLGVNTINHTLLTKYSYDHVGRLLVLNKNIDGAGDKITLQNTYNEFGQVSNESLGQIESRDLTYNIRGWLNSINKNYVETASSSASYFGEEVFYDFGFTSNYSNGVIAGVKWKSTGDDIQRAYGFTYDKGNRLLTADFTQQNKGSTAWTNDLMDFTVSGIKYDPNGNITVMNQRGVNVNVPVDIDSLTYTYFTNSNQLEKVKDKITDMTDWGDFKDTALSADDYAYDVNGNIIKDLNKHIHTGGNSGISYNFLDKATSINVNGKGNIAYTYDASGGLLQKTVTDTKTNIKTVITYIAGFVYQKNLPSTGNASSIPDTLQYVLHEEGRIRWSITQSNPTGSFVYDYFLKDHLNNIRSVITDEQDVVTYPIASLEAASLNNEKVYYDSLDVGRTDKQYVTGYPTDNYTNPNNFIQKLNGNGPKVGASILLKVMAGDKISVHASSWFNSNAAPGTPVSPLTDIVNALLGTIPSASGTKILQQQLTSSMISPDVAQFLNIRNRDNYVGTLPKAFLNIVLFDEQMNPVITTDGKNSYFQQVTDNASQVNPFTIANREMAKSGYVYIFVSNETPNINVFFDNLQVTHTKGPLLQENGYYPFGLEMKTLSSQAALKPQTRYKYNAGTEMEDNFNVDYYETQFREYDPQIGRFTGIDAMSEKSMTLSTYQFGNNSPSLFNDPSGLLSDQEFSTLIYSLIRSPFGGSWTDGGYGDNGDGYSLGYGGGTATVFTNGGEGFAAGAAGMFANNSWGKNGAAESYSSARNSYQSATGESVSPSKFSKYNGQYGVWLNYNTISNNYSSSGLRDVISGSTFVTLNNNFDKNDDGGNLSSRSFVFTRMTSAMYEAGVSGLFFEIHLPNQVPLRMINFKNIYVGFPSSTKDKRKFTTSQASTVSAEAFNNAGLSLALQYQFYSVEQIESLSDRQVQNDFIAAAVFYMNRNIAAGGYVGYYQHGSKTITTPAVWGW